MNKETKAEFHKNAALQNGFDRRIENYLGATGPKRLVAKKGTHLYRKMQATFPRGSRLGQKGAHWRLRRLNLNHAR